MKKISRQVELQQYPLAELSSAYSDLVSRSKEAFQNSHSPYSQFPVGAAILLDNDEIILGSNQENAAYPSGLCAERTALFYFGANFPTSKIIAMAVAVARPIESFPFPCGGCLQVMSEYQQKQEASFDVLLAHPEKDEVLLSHGVENLLPFAFRKEHLGQ